ncbi:peptide chain release factor 1 [Streptomyces cadmiisoli]|uniref:Peptide chain release factor 1 n=1 Tax=Streptomyces cadmiisoli TaxID=2184053 RepID=A0A2Z4J6D6_9ACTN|nr:peptide chain release factor 1 [Streptomyces cadmiisoli]
MRHRRAAAIARARRPRTLCRLPLAACRLPPAACRLPPAACRRRDVVCCRHTRTAPVPHRSRGGSFIRWAVHATGRSYGGLLTAPRSLRTRVRKALGWR